MTLHPAIAILAADVALSDLTTGRLALYPLAMIALGALVKWWMSGTERSIEAIAKSVERLAENVNVQAQSIVRLQVQIEEIAGIRQRQHDLAEHMQRFEGRLSAIKTSSAA